jgi:hypothetical protein
MMTVCKEEEILATVDGGAFEAATLGCRAVGAIAFVTFDFGAEGTMAGAIIGRGAAGAVREAEGSAGGAKRRVNGSRRRKGAGLEIGGAISESG